MVHLTELRAKKIAPGQKPVADGTVRGLWLVPGRIKGQGKWILRFVSPVNGKRRDMGFGAYPDTSIALARDRAREARAAIVAGKDPITERESFKAATAATSAALTFQQAARRVHAA